MRSSCATCGTSLEMSRFVAGMCQRCETADLEGQQGYAAENPGAPLSDILYAGRMARQQFALRPSSNYIDPRFFASQRGLIPTPPQSDRGTPGQ